MKANAALVTIMIVRLSLFVVSADVWKRLELVVLMELENQSSKGPRQRAGTDRFLFFHHCFSVTVLCVYMAFHVALPPSNDPR